jgi:DNA-binding transcriptional LysR family regulator
MPRIPSLDSLRIFVVAARHQSFTDAANELNLTQSAISHRIRGLEDELGLALFKRLTRRLELTPQGRTLARQVGIDSLLALPLLHDSATDGDGSGSDWQTWLEHFGRPDTACHARQHFSEAGMLINAAALGLGVALGRASLVADKMASGALVCPLNLQAPTAFSYYLLGLPEAAAKRKIAIFRSLLVTEAAATEAFMLSIGTPAPTPCEEVGALELEA